LDWHWIDFLIIGFIAWTTFVAFARGLIQELATVVGVILGAILAGRFYADLSADLSFVMDAGANRDMVAFAAIFGGIVVVGQVLSILLKGAADVLMLGAFDHLGGAVFGFLKGLLLVEVALIAVTTFPISEAATAAVQESALAPFFLEAVPIVLGLLPDEFADAVEALPLIPTTLPGSLPGSLPGVLP
jgi:membrane protein required for colicin V production